MIARWRRVDPEVRLLAGIVGMVTTLIPLHRDRVGPREERVFRSVNQLPDALFVPAWLVMQLGTVGSAIGAAVVARAYGDRRLATRLLAAGTATWAASKVVKPLTGRPRPLDLLPDARLRGREASGLGYPSGHAGVAVALGVTLDVGVPLGQGYFLAKPGKLAEFSLDGTK